MEEVNVVPGDLVVAQFGVYQHWAVVSDSFCGLGKPMLISASKRNGTVAEEAWDIVMQGKPTYKVVNESSKPTHQILTDARSQIGQWAYSVLDRNCEHFAKWCSGINVSSKQVNFGVGGALLGATAVASLSKDPKFIKLLGGAALLGGLAVLAAKATESNQTPDLEQI